MNNISMRDAFYNRVYGFAKEDKDLIVISADMGAPALDKFRRDFRERFINIGIAEHNMIAVAAGLASEGKKVFTYAIAPFITARCYEFTKVEASIMKIPIKLVGVGTGFSYDDSGPTHHTTEDISIMRALPNLEILSPSDSNLAAACADFSYNSRNPVYIRLDRESLPKIYDEKERFEEGYKELNTGKEICIVATGNMIHTALEVQKKLAIKEKDIGVIDLYRLKPLNPELTKVLRKYQHIISLEEHLLDGGLGSIISETITDNNLSVKLKRIGLTKYMYVYGGRKNIQRVCAIDADSLEKEVDKLSSVAN